MYDFSTKLKELREERGLSQAQLAKETGLSQSAIAHWEKGIRVPNSIAIITLAYYFDVSTDYILGVSKD